MTSGILLGTRDKREDSKNFFWNKSALLVGIFLLTCRRFVMSARDQRLFLWFLPITVSFSDIAIFNAIVVQATGPWRFKTMWDVSHVLNCGKTRVRVAKDSDVRSEAMAATKSPRKSCSSSTSYTSDVHFHPDIKFKAPLRLN